MTREYEALFILRAQGTEQEVAQAASQLEDVAKKAGATITSSQTMGRRRLAYRIHRQVEGVYHVIRFSATPDKVKELDRAYRLNERVLRFIVLSIDDVEPAPAAAAASRD